MPAYLINSGVPFPSQDAGFLGRAYQPFAIRSDPNLPRFAIEGLSLGKDVSIARLGARGGLRKQLDQLAHRVEEAAAVRSMDSSYQRAFDLILSPAARAAFRLAAEPAAVRERYGRTIFGQSVLLARRLVEAGVPMITVYWPDRKEPEAFINNGVRDSVAVPAWDTHGTKVGNTPNFPALRDRLLPPLDVASSALLEDLQARGLLEQTLLVWTGEFGRSPRINSDGGRDHYGNVFSALLAGGGIRGGQVYGASDKHGAFPADNPVSPGTFAATLYHCLGVPPDAEIPDRLGRPTKVAEGLPIRTLLS